MEELIARVIERSIMSHEAIGNQHDNHHLFYNSLGHDPVLLEGSMDLLKYPSSAHLDYKNNPFVIIYDIKVFVIVCKLWYWLKIGGHLQV